MGSVGEVDEISTGFVSTLREKPSEVYNNPDVIKSIVY